MNLTNRGDGKGRLIVSFIVSFIPLALGVLLFWYLWRELGSKSQFDLRDMVVVPAPAYKMTTIAYALFFSSIAIVFIGTLIYVVQFNKFFDDKNLPGRPYLNWASYFCVASLVLIVICVVLWIVKLLEDTPSICTAQDLLDSLFWHDIFVLAIFTSFLPVDLLTIKGLKLDLAATPDAEEKKKRRNEIKSGLDWASAQLIIIDIPVLLGALGVFVFIHLMESSHHLMAFDSSLVTSGTGWGCKDVGEIEMERFIGNTFIAGAGTGSLAAQILISQIVFMTLGFFFRYRGKEEGSLITAPLEIDDGDGAGAPFAAKEVAPSPSDGGHN